MSRSTKVYSYLLDIQTKSFLALNDGNKLVIDKNTNNAIIYSYNFTAIKTFESSLPPKTGKII